MKEKTGRDALSVLRRRSRELERCWQDLIVNREMNDRNLFERGPGRILTRLEISRQQLDEALVGGGTDLLFTIMKDVTHARHDGVGAVFKELGGHLFPSGTPGGGGGGGGGAPPPLCTPSGSTYAVLNRQMPVEVGVSSYVHIDGNGQRHAFSKEANVLIATAQVELLGVRAAASGTGTTQVRYFSTCFIVQFLCSFPVCFGPHHRMMEILSLSRVRLRTREAPWRYLPCRCRTAK